MSTLVQVNMHDGWTVTAAGGDIPARAAGIAVPATVPGCVHLDLMAAGLIPDPHLDENELDVAWVGRVDWRYQTTFEWDGTGSEVDLVALGLDTVATVELNGTVIGRTANMHRSYRFAVHDILNAGSNTLTITFAAGVAAAEDASAALGPRPHVNTHPFNALRKMACNFGWDWGPILITAGIWRPLLLETWHEARIAAVRPLVEVDGSTGRLHAHVDVQRSAGSDGPLQLHVDIDGVRSSAMLATGESAAVIDVAVPDVRLWWPHGYGDQPLYPVAITLCSDDDELATWSGQVGFRTVELDTSADDRGSKFSLIVNGVPLFARGVNWIPDDSFPSRVTRGRYAERLEQAREANVNLLRVWGGGIYESDDFYEICDQRGLLVWQDFLFACAAYSEEEPLRGEVIAEAREAVTRLSSHPSLALWNGNNENIWGHEDWGWKEPLGDMTWGLGYYTDILPAIVAELDPTRPYSPGTPYSFSADLHPNDPAHGTMHVWDVWNELDYTAYRRYVPRFVAEFGFQGPPTWATLTRAVHDDPLAPDSAGVLLHQKARDGNGKLARGLKTHLPQPARFDDWLWATSLNQARAVALGVEHFRSWSPVCRGTIVWQLNDTWPAVSWAAIDSDGRRKPLWYALRRSYRDRLLTLQPRDGGLTLVAVNDSWQAWREAVTLTRRTFDGAVVSTAVVSLDVGPRSTFAVTVPSAVAATGESQAGELLLAETREQRAWWHPREDIDAGLPAPEFKTALHEIPNGYRLEIVAHTLIRDLALLVDRLAPDAGVDDMLVTLLPGESVTFTVVTQACLTIEQLTDPLVLRCANQLVAD